LLLFTVVPAAHASILTFLEVHRDGVGSVDGLNGAEAVAMSPDGAHIYAGGTTDNALAVFSRNSSTGKLTFVQAVFDGSGSVDGLATVQGVAVSPDGKHVYAAGYGDNAVAVFSRNATTGALTFVQVQKNGTGGITSLLGAYGVTVSPDGKHVYVASSLSGSVTVFSRNATSGALTLVEAQVDGAGGITSLAGAETVVTSPNGAHVYVAAQTDNALTVFSRSSSTGKLTLVEVHKNGTGGADGLAGVQAVTVSPDGAHVYTASNDDSAVAVFGRNATTGALTFVEVKKDGVGGVDGLAGAEWVTVSPNGAYVYGVSDVEDSIVVFSRNATTGALTFVALRREGINGIDGIDGASEAVVSPDSAYL
jgi:6-phosphogluconolactonase (cycloisomerase 2 family)